MNCFWFYPGTSLAHLAPHSGWAMTSTADGLTQVAHTHTSAPGLLPHSLPNPLTDYTGELPSKSWPHTLLPNHITDHYRPVHSIMLNLQCCGGRWVSGCILNMSKFIQCPYFAFYKRRELFISTKDSKLGYSKLNIIPLFWSYQVCIFLSSPTYTLPKTQKECGCSFC